MNYIEKQKLTVLIITLNEEFYIKSLLDDLDFADEIIVIDSFSTDRTVDIVNSFENIKLIQNPFDNYTSQRNFALSQATNNWVLFIDADEKLSSGLKSEIIFTINNSKTVSAYLIYRTFMFKNLKLRFSGWQTDKIFRLFDKTKCNYSNERLVHEKLNVNGKIATLQNKLIHYSYNNYTDYKAKMKYYGFLKAQEKFKNHQRHSILMMLFHPVYTFLYQFLIRLGILDGHKGIIICYLNAYSIYIRYKELKKLTDSKT